MRLALIGYGRMGREVEAAALQRGHEVALVLAREDNVSGAGFVTDRFASIDVAIEFTEPECVVDNLDAATAIGVPVVVGTTGWDEHLARVRSMVQQREGAAVVHGANFSIGANLFLRIVEQAALLFDPFADYDPYVFEHHHRGKADAPSGTALRLARALTAASRTKATLQVGNPEGAIAADALHVASLRAGSAFGEHRVGFDADADAVELVHTARSRSGFARGALLAAEWVAGREGLYAFDDVLEDLLGGDAPDARG